jgi:GTP cyclohydrolase I
MPRVKSADELPDARNIIDVFPKQYTPSIGFKNIVIPLLVSTGTKDKGVYTKAVVSLNCDMAPDNKGANIINLRRIVEKTRDTNRVIPEFTNIIISYFQDELKVQNGKVVVEYDFLNKKTSPVSNTSSWMDYKASYVGTLVNGVKHFYSTVTVYYNSVCPRSKEISDYGAHNQLSSATITTEVVENSFNLNEIISVVDDAASAPIYNIIDDLDESYLTEQAYENPVFVEDVARKIAVDLTTKLDNTIKDYLVEINHHESIHTSITTASINAGRTLK